MVRLEAEYAAFWAQNGSTMTAYDAAVNAATMFHPVPAPPQLVVPDPASPQAAQGMQDVMGKLSQAMQQGLSKLGMGSLADYAGPSPEEADLWKDMVGAGGGGLAGSGGAGFDAGLMAPMVASFPGGAATGVIRSPAPAFGGVSNTASMGRGGMPMAPPMAQQQDKKGLDRENGEIVAAVQEFTWQDENPAGAGAPAQSPVGLGASGPH
jgi:hypothetical protein